MEFQQIDKFEIRGKLGQGSFGVVYRGWDPDLKREVAIKLCAVEDEDLRRRFSREAEISGSLEHDNIVKAYSFGFQDNVPYLVQEYLEGEDLSDAIKHGRTWSAADKLDLLAQVAEGLGYAHGRGVVHRDIKPSNIRLLDGGRLKIMDFGIAKLANDESQLTQKGVTMGTASYLPPEQVRGSETDHRSDIFSFGVLAYELLSGERPFRGKTISALIYQILYKAPPPLGQKWADCPREIGEWVDRCLEKEASKRYQDIASLVAELQVIRDRVEDGQWPVLARPVATSAAPTPLASDADEAEDTSEIMSRSMISRTAADVQRKNDGQRGNAPRAGVGGPTRPVDVVPPPEPSAASTQSVAADLPTTPKLPTVSPPTSSQAPASAASDPAKTVAIRIPDLPPPPPLSPGAPGATAEGGVANGGIAESGAPESHAPESHVPESHVPEDHIPESHRDAEGEGEDLASSAQEISQLVAQGNLQAAMEQLEETMNRQEGPLPDDSLAANLDEFMPTAEMPQASLAAAAEKDLIRADAPTVPMPRATAPIAGQTAGQAVDQIDASATLPVAGASASTDPAATLPPLGRPTTAEQPSGVAAAQLQAQQSPVGSPSGSTVGSSLAQRMSDPTTRKIVLGVVVAGALVCLFTFGWWLANDSSPAPVVTAPPPSPPKTALAVPSTLSGLIIDATPWALVMEITDAKGFVQELPVEASTPYFLELPEGRYQVALRHPDHEEIQSCEVQLMTGAVASCVTTFAEPTATEYFKEAGWWR